MNPNEANRIARSKGFDLVEISPNAKPPVCKIIDYGKYNYERQKKEKLAKKNQVVMTVKEIRFNANTDTHDIDFKTRHLKQFLIDGHKVKATVLYKGRMITHPEIGKKLMDEILEKVVEVGKLESPPKLEGKMLTSYLTPDKNKILTYKNKLAKEQRELEKMGKSVETVNKEIEQKQETDKSPETERNT